MAGSCYLNLGRAVITTVLAFVFMMFEPAKGAKNIKTVLSFPDNYHKAQYFERQGNKAQAVIYYEQALKDSENKGKWREAVITLLHLSDIAESNHSTPAFNGYLKKAKRIITLHLGPRDKLNPEILYKRGMFYLDQNKLKEAGEMFSQCLPGANHFEIEDSTLSKVYGKIGLVNYYKGNYPNAIVNIEKSISLATKVYGLYSLRVAQGYGNLGVMNFMLAEYDKALNNCDRAELIYGSKGVNDEVGLASTYQNKSLIFKIRNDYVLSIQYLNRALQIYLKNEKQNRQDISAAYFNLGATYQMKGNKKSCIYYYKKSLDYCQKYNPTLLPKVYGNIAAYYEQTRHWNLANYYFLFGIGRTKEILGENIELAYQYNNYAYFLGQVLHRRAEAEKYYLLAYSRYLKYCGFKHPSTALCLKGLGKLYADEGNYMQALDYYQKALILVSENFHEKDILKNPPEGRHLFESAFLEIIKEKARILSEMADKSHNLLSKWQILRSSLECYALAVDQIDRFRCGYMNEESKYLISENEQETFSGIIDISLKLYELTHLTKYKEKAFYYSDRNKSANLQAFLRQKEALQLGGVPIEIQNLEQDLKRESATYTSLIQNEKSSIHPDQDHLKLWEKKLFDNTLKTQNLVGFIERRYPRYFQLKYNNSDVDLEKLQKKLGPNDDLIEYEVVNEKVVCFLISKNKFKVRSFSLDTTFDQSIREVLAFISSSAQLNISSKDYLNFQRNSHSLYEKLLGPFESEIKNKNLVIVPDGKLTYLPFEVLLSKSSADRYLHFKDLPYLIRDHSVRYSYSAGLIEDQKERFAKWHPRLLAFAPDYVDGKGESLLAYTGQRQGYEPLPGVAEEVMSIARFMPGKIILGRKATKTAFVTFANDYDVLHLAMHAVINDENPMFSTLVFASDNPRSSMGLLNTFEIYNQDLQASMAVLSACNTGKGQLRKGEGMISLARGFAYAGVPSIVMTLWSVNDNSSAKLMTGFYSFLAKGADKASSLRNAKMNYIQQASVLKSHPFYWAGYVLTGSNSPLYLSGTSYIPLAGLLLIVLALFYVWKRFKRRKK